jgi:hypothetical protein
MSVMSDESFICETCGQKHEGLPLPFAGSDDEFGWGLWVEVDRAQHDAYVSLFDRDASSAPRFRGRLAKEIPGYGGTMGVAVEVEIQPAGDGPKLFFRAQDILEAIGFFRKNTGAS